MLVALIKINMLLLVLILVYYLALRNLTFYRLNRVYFLLAIGCAVAYPFIDLSSFINEAQQTALNQYVPAVSYNFQKTSGILYTSWIAWLFFTGLAIMLMRLVRQFISLYTVHKNSVSGRIDNITVQFIQVEAGPFSFGRHIYVNPSLHTEHELKTILTHERIHVRQWHTVDIMLAEIMLLCCWFNPAAWLMSKALRENLEFITDEAILQKGFDRKLYQYSLLQATAGSSAIAISNEFTLHNIKKRIRMMNERRSSRLRLVAYGAFPVLLAASLLFTVSVKRSEELIRAFADKIEAPATPAVTVTTQNSVGIINHAADGNKPNTPGRNTSRRGKPVSAGHRHAADLNSAADDPAEKAADQAAGMQKNLAGPAPVPADPLSIETNTGEVVVQGVRRPEKNNTEKQVLPVTPKKDTDQEPIVVVGYPKPKNQ